MKNVIKLKGLLLIATLLFSACEKGQVLERENSFTDESSFTNANLEIIKTPINPITGEPEVMNYNPKDYNPTNLKSGKKVVNNSLASGPFENSVKVKIGRSPNHDLEVDGKLPSGYAITGIGARTTSDEITTLVLEARYVFNNGILGPKELYKFGPKPNHSLEVWYAVPDQHVVTGFGARIADNDFVTMAISHRKLEGNGRLSNRLYKARVGSDPNRSLEAEYDPSDYNFNESKAVMTRIGMREKDSDLTTLVVRSSALK